MPADAIDYGELMQEALKGVMRAALKVAANTGLPGRHHFYVTFRTDHPGIQIAPHLRAQYAEEMTIVLQHQFDTLTIDDEGFGVTLRFNRRPEYIQIPFDAVTAFVDPAVNFALHFQPQDGEGGASLGDIGGQADGQTPIGQAPPGGGTATNTPASDEEPGPDDDGAGAGGTVISLDSFRNKK